MKKSTKTKYYLVEVYDTNEVLKYVPSSRVRYLLLMYNTKDGYQWVKSSRAPWSFNERRWRWVWDFEDELFNRTVWTPCEEVD